MGKKIEEKGGFDLGKEEGKEEDGLWGRLKSIFESTYEVLQELAKERGIKIEDIYTSEKIDREFWGEESGDMFKEGKLFLQIEESPILKICKIYEYWADRCLEKVLKFPCKKQAGLEEDLEIVSWYLDLIQAKMRRALRCYFNQEEIKMCGTEDFNGLVKVALIAIDRSAESWEHVQKGYPDYRMEIEHLLVMLKQLKTDIEHQFPYARKYLRPGFEKPVVMK